MIPTKDKSLRKSIKFTIFFCIFIGLMFPTFYLISSIGNLKGVLATEAEINSRLVNKLISDNPDLWQYETVRLEELLSRRPLKHVPEVRRIISNNKIIAESHDQTSWPEISIEHVLVDSGEVVGKIEIIRSIRTLILRSAIFSLFGLTASFLLYRLLPFNALAVSSIKLKEANSFLIQVMEASSNSIVVLDLAGRIFMANNKFEKLTGYEKKEFLGQHICDVLKGEARTEFDNYFSIIDSNHLNAEFESTLLNKDQYKQDVICKIEPILINGASEHLVVSVENITARRKYEEEKLELEQRIQHSQRLDSLGMLSGGIAHDFNNILAIIMGYCSLIKLDVETALENVSEIEKAVERASGLCSQMLAYAGKAQLTKTRINMFMLVSDMVSMLKSTLPKNAVIQSRLSTATALIEGDESQLRQVIMNLIINASEALGIGHGEINVILDNKQILTDKPESDYNGNAISPGMYVFLEVTDDGCGMDEETRWRIFEPFYTTKFVGRGLGMSAVLGIIMSHKGSLQLFSKLGEGSTFKIYLPIIKMSHEEKQSGSLPLPWQGKGTILLVEDEDQIRFVIKIILEKLGFTVLEAVNGKEALEIYSNYASEVVLVFTDIGMPVMDGYELLTELRAMDSSLPIIISSGFGASEIHSRIGVDERVVLINKPFRTDHLRTILKQALD